MDPARDAGFLAVDAGLADAFEEGFALAARDAGFADPARDALDAGLAAALLAGFAALEAGLAYSGQRVVSYKAITGQGDADLLRRGLISIDGGFAVFGILFGRGALAALGGLGLLLTLGGGLLYLLGARLRGGLLGRRRIGLGLILDAARATRLNCSISSGRGLARHIVCL